MSKFIAGSPDGTERREFGATSSIHAARVTPKSSWQKHDDIFFECPSRDHLVRMLNSQVEQSVNSQKPVCLTLVELDQQESAPSVFSETTLAVVSKIFRSQLRPGDQIIRYKDKTLGLILPETDADGGATVSRRLHQAISRKLHFGHRTVAVTPIFGLSGSASRKAHAEQLLVEAESALEKARAKTA